MEPFEFEYIQTPEDSELIDWVTDQRYPAAKLVFSKNYSGTTTYVVQVWSPLSPSSWIHNLGQIGRWLDKKRRHSGWQHLTIVFSPTHICSRELKVNRGYVRLTFSLPKGMGWELRWMMNRLTQSS